jgi:hypothetical protein
VKTSDIKTDIPLHLQASCPFEGKLDATAIFAPTFLVWDVDVDASVASTRGIRRIPVVNKFQ